MLAGLQCPLRCAGLLLLMLSVLACEAGCPEGLPYTSVLTSHGEAE